MKTHMKRWKGQTYLSPICEPAGDKERGKVVVFRLLGDTGMMGQLFGGPLWPGQSDMS